MLFVEGVTVTLEGGFVGVLGAIADVWAGVCTGVDEILMLLPPTAAPEISEGSTYCSQMPFLLKVNSWVNYKTDYYHLQQKQNDR